MNATILTGDVLDKLRTLPDTSVQCVVTSPPYYGLRDYGVPGQIGLEPTPAAYVARMVEVFREVRRVLRDDGCVFLNLGDSYVTGTTAARSNGNRGIGDATQEAQDSVPRCGGMAKQLLGIPWRVAFALQEDGWWLRSDIIWAKPNPMPESVTDRPTKSHEYIFLLTKSARYFYDAEAIKEASTESTAERAQYGWNGKMVYDQDGKETYRSQPDPVDKMGDRWCPSYRNARSVWTIATQPYPEAHFATFPEELPRRCILAGSKGGDTVLDPFAGSGTTLAVALQLGRNAIGIELNPEYVKLAERRLAGVTPALFGV